MFQTTNQISHPAAPPPGTPSGPPTARGRGPASRPSWVTERWPNRAKNHGCFTDTNELGACNKHWLVVLTILKDMKVNGKDYPESYD